MQKRFWSKRFSAAMKGKDQEVKVRSSTPQGRLIRSRLPMASCSTGTKTPVQIQAGDCGFCFECSDFEWAAIYPAQLQF